MSFFSSKSISSSTPPAVAPEPMLVRARRASPEAFTLVLSVVSAEGLRFSASQSSYCKLYVGETPVMHATNSALSSLWGKSKSKTKGPEVDPAATHHSAHTAVTQSEDRSTAEWNETLELPVRDPSTDVLSCRIKNQLPLYCPSIGAAVLPLQQLPVGASVTKTLPLFKANKFETDGSDEGVDGDFSSDGDDRGPGNSSGHSSPDELDTGFDYDGTPEPSEGYSSGGDEFYGGSSQAWSSDMET